jgi:ribosomal-protein-alanine N-acetyltransferase
MVLDRVTAERHVEALADLDARMYAELGAAYSHIPWYGAHFVKDVPGKWALSHCALDEGRLCAFWVASTAADLAHTHRVAVDGALRGHGVGTALFEAVARAAGHAGCRRMTLTVNVTNEAAVRFYERLGFAQLRGAALREFVAVRGRAGEAAADVIYEDESDQRHAYVALMRSIEGPGT